MTEHATQQIKEVARRLDGKKYIINEDNCAEHQHKVYGKMPGVTTYEEWKLNEDDEKYMQTTDSQHSPNVNVVPNAYLNQMTEFEGMKKVGGYLRVGQKEDDTRLSSPPRWRSAWMICS